jgi:3-oxoisoapionate kinase
MTQPAAGSAERPPGGSTPRPAMGCSGLRLAFYGDDFTGSTDALEVLALAGQRCALFLAPPSPEMLQRFGTLDAIGVAGDSRGMSPDEMDRHLPPLLRALATLDAPLVHYKVCSTFDSAPAIGSIGRVMEIARRELPGPFIPIVAGTPGFERYCLFGHLFARSATDDRVHRIDRHPIMNVHPVTPMDESDLARHFARQTTMKIDNLPFPALEGGPDGADERLRTLVDDGAQAIVLDSASAAHLTEVGRLLDRLAREAAPLFVVGSSGAEYALTQWWQVLDAVPAPPEDYARFEAVDRVLAVSGSASRLSGWQIDAAVAAGFAEIALDAGAIVDDARWPAAAQQAVSAATAWLQAGRSVIVHSARGPEDPRIEQMIGAMRDLGHTRAQAKHEGGRTLATRMGFITRDILRAVPLQRLLLAGGDTSSQVTKVLAPDALVMRARLSRGAPLCRFVGGGPGIDGLEVALKGGQAGDKDFFERARAGQS